MLEVPLPLPQYHWTASSAGFSKKVLSSIARRAYRRSVTPDDVKTLIDFYQRGRSEGNFDTGIRAALERLLISPDFLFRIEADPDATAPGTPYRLTDVELASRLSFFLWSSIPDDELLDLAIRGKLREGDTLDRQARRMPGRPIPNSGDEIVEAGGYTLNDERSIGDNFDVSRCRLSCNQRSPITRCEGQEKRSGDDCCGDVDNMTANTDGITFDQRHVDASIFASRRHIDRCGTIRIHRPGEVHGCSP